MNTTNCVNVSQKPMQLLYFYVLVLLRITLYVLVHINALYAQFIVCAGRSEYKHKFTAWHSVYEGETFCYRTSVFN